MSLLISTSLSTSFLKPQDLQRFFRLMKSLLSARFNFSRYRLRLWVISVVSIYKIAHILFRLQFGVFFLITGQKRVCLFALFDVRELKNSCRRRLKADSLLLPLKVI